MTVIEPSVLQVSIYFAKEIEVYCVHISISAFFKAKVLEDSHNRHLHLRPVSQISSPTFF